VRFSQGLAPYLQRLAIKRLGRRVVPHRLVQHGQGCSGWWQSVDGSFPKSRRAQITGLIGKTYRLLQTGLAHTVGQLLGLVHRAVVRPTPTLDCPLLVLPFICSAARQQACSGGTSETLMSLQRTFAVSALRHPAASNCWIVVATKLAKGGSTVVLTTLEAGPICRRGEVGRRGGGSTTVLEVRSCTGNRRSGSIGFKLFVIQCRIAKFSCDYIRIATNCVLNVSNWYQEE